MSKDNSKSIGGGIKHLSKLRTYTEGVISRADSFWPASLNCWLRKVSTVAARSAVRLLESSRCNRPHSRFAGVLQSRSVRTSGLRGDGYMPVTSWCVMVRTAAVA